MVLGAGVDAHGWPLVWLQVWWWWWRAWELPMWLPRWMDAGVGGGVVVVIHAAASLRQCTADVLRGCCRDACGRINGIGRAAAGADAHRLLCCLGVAARGRLVHRCAWRPSRSLRAGAGARWPSLALSPALEGRTQEVSSEK